MKKDIEQQLFDYPLLDRRAEVLRQQANLLRENMDIKTEVLLDDKHLSDEAKKSLVDALQQNELVLFKLLKSANELEIQKSVISAGLALLTKIEYKIVTGYYFEDKSIEDLRQELGYSYSWTHKLKAKAVSKLIDVLEVE